MSALIGLLKTSEITCPTGEYTHLLQMQTPANHRAKVLSWGISLSNLATTGSALVDLLRYYSTGTDGTTVTPQKQDIGINETIQTTAIENINGTAPTAGEVLKSMELNYGFQEDLPFNQEYIVTGNGLLGIRCSPSANNGSNSIQGVAWMRFEE